MHEYFGADKPFKTTEEQIDILRKRGLEINDEKLANSFLLSKNYHILINSYKPPFTYLDSNDDEMFQPGTSFEDLVRFYYFDETLRNILFNYIISFERSFNIAMSDALSQSFGVSMNRYLRKENFKNRHGKVKSVLKEIWKIRKSKYNPTKHYREKKNHIPFWVLSQNMTFGQIRMFYSILNVKEKEFIVSQIFNLQINSLNSQDKESLKKLLKKILTIILGYRNNLAHGGNLVTYRSDSTFSQNDAASHEYRLTKADVRLLWPKGIATNSTWDKNKLGRNDTYCLLICIMSGLSSHYFDQRNFAFELENNFFNRYKDLPNFGLYLKSVGLPEDLDRYLNNFINPIK